MSGPPSVRSAASRLFRDKRGGNFVEYLILIGVVALLAVLAWRKFGNAVVGATHAEGEKVALLESGNGGVGGNGGAGGPGQCLGGLCLNGNGCFAAGTLVATEEGLRPIDELRVGDLVESRDDVSGTTSFQPVTRTFVTPDMPLVDVRDSARSEAIRCTPGHLFHTADRGWIQAQSLVPNEPLLALGEAELRVESVTAVAEQATVYNIEVDRTHTYFVGPEGAWVHNPWWKCGGGGAAEPPPPPPPPQLTPAQALSALTNNPTQFLSTYPLRVDFDPPNTPGSHIAYMEPSPGVGFQAWSIFPQPWAGGGIRVPVWYVPTDYHGRPDQGLGTWGSPTSIGGVVLPQNGPSIAVIESQSGCTVVIGTCNDNNPIAAHLFAGTPRPAQYGADGAGLANYLRGHGWFSNGTWPDLVYGPLTPADYHALGGLSAGYIFADRATVVCLRGNDGAWTCYAQRRPFASGHPHYPPGTDAPPVLSVDTIYTSPPQPRQNPLSGLWHSRPW